MLVLCHKLSEHGPISAMMKKRTAQASLINLGDRRRLVIHKHHRATILGKTNGIQGNVIAL